MILTLRQIAEKAGLSYAAVRKRRRAEGWISAGSRVVNGQDAEAFDLADLPLDIRIIFSERLHSAESRAFSQKPPVADGGKVPRPCPRSSGSSAYGRLAGAGVVRAPALLLSDADIDAHIYATAPAWARKKADRDLFLYKKFGSLKGQALKEAIAQHNERHPDLKTSYPSVMRIRKTIEEEGRSGLLAQYGKAAGKTAVRDEWFEHFKKVYLKEGAPSAKSCWISTLGFARVSAMGFPSPKAFLRRLEKEIPKRAIYQARYGKQKYNARYGRYLDRDYSGLRPGECIVSDHAQVDVAVRLPNGKACFPWVTAWRDFKSGKWLGWHHHSEPPNSDHIFQSFYYAVKGHGLPTDIYIDNGKDYRVRDFAGGRCFHKVDVDEVRTTAMLSLLEITPHFSIPYNPQSKTIERDFLKNKEWFSKHCPGYRGGHVKERPEALKKEIKEGRILPWNEYEKLLDGFIIDVLNRTPSNGKVLQGRCPDEVWERERIEMRRPRSKDSLRLFCMRTSKPLTVGRNGVRDSELGVTYWSEEMSGIKGRKVYLRRDPKDYGEAWVFGLDDAFLCMAHIADRPAALARTPEEKAGLKAHMAAKRQEEKIIKAYCEIKDRPSPAEALEYLKAGVAALNESRGYRPGKEDVSIIRLGDTKMDRALRKRKEMEEEGTGEILPPPPRKRPPLYLYEADKEIDEERRRKRNVG